MMRKTVCYLMCLFLAGLFFTGPVFADAPQKVRYISNRIKIERPEKLPVAPPEKPVAEKEKEPIAAPPSEVAAPAAAEAAAVQAPALISPEEMEAFFGKEGRLYSSKGRVDPFEPFLHKEETKASTGLQEMLQIRAPQTPLERIDISQLKLTAILQTSDRMKALVEEASGKGYVVSEGTYIGNNGGQVSQILRDRVVVKERYLDIFGKIAVRDRELKLQKEPGE